MTLLEYMIQDMKEPLDYLPRAVLAGAAAGILFYLSMKRSPRLFPRSTARNTAWSTARNTAWSTAQSTARNTGRWSNAIVISLFVTYLYVMLQEAFFSRPPGSRTSVDLVLLGTWGRSLQGNAYVLENIIMFIPWGILLSLLIKLLRRNGWLCVLTAFLASMLLETVQFITQRGHCQLDDVVMNTLGGFIGWFAVRTADFLGRHWGRRI